MGAGVAGGGPRFGRGDRVAPCDPQVVGLQACDAYGLNQSVRDRGDDRAGVEWLAVTAAERLDGTGFVKRRGA